MPQQKLGIVQTQDSPATVLTLKADIPTLISTEKPGLTWATGALRSAQRVRIHVADKQLGGALGAEVSNPGARVTLEKIYDGSDYWLEVTPPARSAAFSATVRLTKGWPKQDPQTVTAEVSVN